MLVLYLEKHHHWVHSSVVEHLTADQEVTDSNPVGPFFNKLSRYFIENYCDLQDYGKIKRG